MSEPKHTWRFTENSLLIRFYCAIWHADKNKIDFCKLFWGIVFSPLALIVWPFALIARTIGRLLPEPKPHAYDDEWYESYKARRAKREARKEKFSRIPEAIGNFFAKPLPRAIFKWTGLAISVIGGLALTAWLVYAIITNFIGFLIAFAVVIGLILFLAVAIGTLEWFDKTGRAKRFGMFMKDGYHHVKNNTCPKIEVQ